MSKIIDGFVLTDEAITNSLSRVELELHAKRGSYPTLVIKTRTQNLSLGTSTEHDLLDLASSINELVRRYDLAEPTLEEEESES
jgi:hypothetical protein